MLPDLLDAPLAGYDPDAVLAAVATVRGYCGWHIATSYTETATVDGSGDRYLLLPSLHITAVTSVVENGITLDPTAYTILPGGQLRRRGGYVWGWEDTVVTFTHGYTACPLEVRAVVARLAKNGLTGLTGGSAQVGQVRVQAAESEAAGTAGLDLYGQAILDRYCLPGRP